MINTLVLGPCIAPLEGAGYTWRELRSQCDVVTCALTKSKGVALPPGGIYTTLHRTSRMEFRLRYIYIYFDSLVEINTRTGGTSTAM